jgi:hypothetical protein
MGATTFRTTSLGRDVGDAYRQAVDHARWESGHGGYTGTIAEKSGYVLYEIPQGVRCSASRFADLVNEAAYLAETNDLTEDLEYYRSRLTKTEIRKREAEIRKEEKLRNRFFASLNPALARVVKEAAPVYDDKWGPAVAIEVKGKDAVEVKKYAGRKGTHDRVFLFCGYASC